MEGILIIIGFWLGLLILRWMISTISKLIRYFKYHQRLNRLAPSINAIDLSIAEKELTRLTSVANSTFSRIKDKHKVSTSEAPPSVEHFIKIDEAQQKAKRRTAKPRTRIYKRRYWR